MKIAVVAPTYLPARRANTIQVMKMAQAMVSLGIDVRVFVPGDPPGESGGSWDEIAKHYGLLHQFEIDWLPVNLSLRRYDYGYSSVKHAQKWDADLLYTRLPQAAAIASILGIPTVYEIHDLPKGLLNPWLLTRFLKGRGARVLVVITHALKDALTPWIKKQSSLPVLVAPDGVDLARYENLPSPEDARQSLINTLPPSQFMVGYTGHLYPGRGAELILEIAAQLTDVDFLLVGGEPTDVTRIQGESETRGINNITLTGFIPNAELPRYQAACNILLMPYQKQVAASSGGDISHFLSPMKVFEYLACGRVILSSDLPVLRELLNEQNAVLLPPEKADAWVNAIQDIRGDPQKKKSLSIKAREDAQQYSWKSRAERMLALVN
jgi:glycosyltransferase involved in cell wall biosynthesis